jgi:hypothetical protein
MGGGGNAFIFHKKFTTAVFTKKNLRPGGIRTRLKIALWLTFAIFIIISSPLGKL